MREQPCSLMETQLAASWHRSVWWQLAVPRTCLPLEAMPHFESQSLITWLISGQGPTPATAQGPWQLGGQDDLRCLYCSQAIPGTAVWSCLSWLLSPQPLLLAKKCSTPSLAFVPGAVHKPKKMPMQRLTHSPANSCWSTHSSAPSL